MKLGNVTRSNVTTGSAKEASDLFDDISITEEQAIWIMTWGTHVPSNETTPDYYFIIEEDFQYNEGKLSAKY